MSSIIPLRDFVIEVTKLIDVENVEANLIKEGKVLLERLISDDGWLPDSLAKPGPDSYRQNLLWCDPLERFSIVSFVWGPGQTTPIHDHTIWGLIGMLRGSETGQTYSIGPDGKLEESGQELLTPGMVSAVSPSIGDIHKVSNALVDKTSISIHLYGANIGAVRRHLFDSETHAVQEFISGYSNKSTPNLFDRSVSNLITN